MWPVTSIKFNRWISTILNEHITYHRALPCPKVSVLFLILCVFTTVSAYDIGQEKFGAFDTFVQSLYSIFLRHSLKREIGSPKEESKQSSPCPVWRSINWRDAPKHGEVVKKASTACLLASRAETGDFHSIELSIIKTNILLYTPLTGVGIHKDLKYRHFPKWWKPLWWWQSWWLKNSDLVWVRHNQSLKRVQVLQATQSQSPVWKSRTQPQL